MPTKRTLALLAVIAAAACTDKSSTAPAADTAAAVTPVTPAPQPASAFDIELVFITTMTSSQQAAFAAAANRWRSVITADIGTANASRIPANACVEGQPALNEAINDLRIYVRVTAMDGPGKTLGSAGPCLTRASNDLTVVGVMSFDSADLHDMENDGSLGDVILHEMGHVLGIGTLWSDKGLLEGEGSSDPFFTGSAAIARFDMVGGQSFAGSKVPVENSGGEGTRDGHWRESVFRRELMTGYINSGSNPMSVVTIGSLQDLGYTVSFAPANAYSWAGLRIDAPGVTRHLVDDVLRIVPRSIPDAPPGTQPGPLIPRR